MTITDALGHLAAVPMRYAVVLAWCAPLALLILPLQRLVRRRSRHLDALWAVLMLGVVNRLMSDFSNAPPTLTSVSAILMAGLLAAAIWSYQRADR